MRTHSSLAVFTLLLTIIILCPEFCSHVFAIEDERDHMQTIQVVDSLNELARKSRSQNIDQLGTLAHEALQLAQAIRYKNGQMEAFGNLAVYYYGKEDYYNSLRCRFQTIDLLRQNGNHDSIVQAYLELSAFFREIKDPARASKYLQYAGRLAGNSDKVSLGLYYMEKGQLNYYMTNYAEAVRDLYYALYFFSKSQSKPIHLVYVFKFLGDAYLQQEKYTKAIYDYQVALNISRSNNVLAETGVLLTRLAHVYSLINDDEKVMELNVKALGIRKILGQTALVASSYLNIGNTFNTTGRPDSALVYFKKGLALSESLNHKYLIETYHKQLYEFYLEQHNYKQAYESLVRYQEMHQKRLIEINKYEIGLLEARHMIREAEISNELLMKEYEYQTLQLSSRDTQLILFEIFFIMLLAISLLIYSLYRHNLRRKKALHELNDRLRLEIKSRNEAEAGVIRSEALYRFLADHSGDMISIVEPDLGRTFVSPSCKMLYGYTVEEMMAIKSYFDLIDPAFHEQVREGFAKMIGKREPMKFLFKAIRKDGSTFWAESIVNPFYHEETGALKELITVIRDVTDRMISQEAVAENARQKEMLLREIHNRVKNNFSVLISLMNMQRDLNPLLSQSLNELQLRVRTMSLVHEQLYHTRNISIIPLGEYLRNLVTIITEAFNNDRIEVEIDIRECDLNIEMALPLGLIVNELLTNSFKYAFPGNRKGTIHVSLLPGENDRWALMIRDDGIGLTKDFTATGNNSMGSQIVQILVEQIEADFEVKGNGGTTFTVKFSAMAENNL